MSRLRGGRPEGRGCQLASAVQVAGTYGGKGEYDSVHGLIAVEFPYRGPRRGGVDRHDRGSASGSRDWTRTSNLPVNSRLLCQLSYAGSLADLSAARPPTIAHPRKWERWSTSAESGTFRPTEDPMRYRLTFLVGLGAGYVLGARAGRERYDQLMRSFREAKEQPAVQSAAGVVAAQASGFAEKAKSAVAAKVGG